MCFMEIPQTALLTRIVHHRHYPTTRLSPALGTTQLLRARRGVPNFIITSTDPSARIYRLRIKIIKNPNRAT